MDITYTRSVLIGLTRLWWRKSYRKWTSGLFFWICELLLTIEYSYHMRMIKSQEVELVHQSNYNQSFLWQNSLLLSRFFLKNSCHPPSPFLFFFVEHLLLLFTRKLLCFFKPSRFQLFGMQIILMLLFLVWISMDV